MPSPLSSSRRLLALLLLLGAGGCRKAPAASEDYAQAHARFSAVYARRLDDAFVDPEMDRVLAQLKEVPGDSLDAASAVALRKRIEDGRAAAGRRAAQQEKDRAALRAPAASDPRGFDIPRAQAPLKIEPVLPEDAGVAAAGPSVGTLERDLANYRGCFTSGPPVTVAGKGALPRYELVDRLGCRQEYPAFADRLLLIEQGKVAIISSKSAVRRVSADAGM